MNRKPFLTIILLTILLLGQVTHAQQLEPFSKRIKTSAGTYKASSWVKVPLITWGADMVTIQANGGKLRTVSGSDFDQQGLKIELFREDDFQKQVDQFIKGDLTYLRGTMGMINMAADITEKNTKTKLVVIYQHSWSAGGDALVVKPGIANVAGLKGKTIAIQSYGPHVDYLMKLLKDAGLAAKDVTIVWTRDLVGPEGDTPMAKLYTKNVDAAFVIIPDALALTSNGTVGTGAEDSVKGAKILLSTKTANRIISDVYAVRKDYFDANQTEVKKFVHAMLLAEETVAALFREKKSTQYKNLLTSSAAILLDSSQASEEVAGLFYDAELAGYDGNVQFFTDTNYPRNFSKLNNEIQDAFISLGLLSKRVSLAQAGWNYRDFQKGLADIDTTADSRFDQTNVSTVVTKKQQQNTIDESSLFAFEIYFKPNQNDFPVSAYKAQFEQVIELAATYGGAIITVEGHSDPMGYLRQQKEGASQVVLNKVKQSAKNLSYSRANGVKDEVVNYAASQGITLDPNQFAIIGYGIEKPMYAVPQTEQQWLDNMRVEFKIIQVEAEADVFMPL